MKSFYFDYNAREEVTNAVMHSIEQSIVYDDIGNRTTSIVDSVSSVYTANQINQYTAVSSIGSITHDADGNLTSGNGWIHTYNAENRPITHQPIGNVTNGSILVENKYNYKNLRVEKITKQLSGREAGYPMNPQADPGTWDAIETRKYIWDGFNIAAEIIIDHVTPATNISYYTWGLDLSGTLQGAGGVGGLLSDTKVTSIGTNSFYAVGDANGNITEYVDVSVDIKAHGEHNAFGETELSGSVKGDFTHWFSSKPLDVETGLIHYQLRPYSPELAIFLPRDPMEEAGSIGLHQFTENNPICRFDYLGLHSIKITEKKIVFVDYILPTIPPGGASGQLKNPLPSFKNQPSCKCSKRKYMIDLTLKVTLEAKIVGKGVSHPVSGQLRTRKGILNSISHENNHRKGLREAFTKIENH